MSVPDISVEVAKKVTAIGQEMKSRATRGSRALKNAELQVLRGQRGGRSYKMLFVTLPNSNYSKILQIKRRYSIIHSDVLSVRLFYPVPSCVIMT